MAMRVAWFGHAGGRRPTGSPLQRPHRGALVGTGCEVRFFHHDLDGDRTPVPDSLALEGVRFKTMTLPAPRTLDRIETRPDRVPPRRRPLLPERLPPRRRGRPRGARPRRRDGRDLSPPLCPRAERAGPGDARPVPVPRPPASGVRPRIALCGEQRDLLVRAGLRPERIVVMPNAVDTRRFSPGPSPLHQTLGAALVVAYLGRLDPEKRVEELVRSFLDRRWPGRPPPRHRRERQSGEEAPPAGRGRPAGSGPGGGQRRRPSRPAPRRRHLRPPLDRRGALDVAPRGDGGGLPDHRHRCGRARAGAGPAPGWSSRVHPWSPASERRSSGCAATPAPGAGSGRPPGSGSSTTTASTATSRTSSASTPKRSRPEAR